MASYLENLNIPPCTWFESGEKRNALASILAGTLVIACIFAFKVVVFFNVHQNIVRNFIRYLKNNVFSTISN